MGKILKKTLLLAIIAAVGVPQAQAATNDYSIEVKNYSFSKHSRATNPLYGITYTEEDGTYTDRNWPLVEISHAYQQSNYSNTLPKHQIVRQFGVSMGVVYWINPVENYIYWWNTVTGESGRTTPTKSYGVGYQDGINNPNFDFEFLGAETGSGAISQDWHGNLVHMWNDGLNGWGTTAGTHFVQGYAVYKAPAKYGQLMDFTPKLSKMNDTGRQNYPYYYRQVTGSGVGTLNGSTEDHNLAYYDYKDSNSKTPNPNYPANTITWANNWYHNKADESIAKQPTDFLGVSGNLWGKGVLQGASQQENFGTSDYNCGWATGYVFHARNNIAFGNMFADGQYTNWYLNYQVDTQNTNHINYYPIAGQWTSENPNVWSPYFIPGSEATTNNMTEYLFRETDVLEYFWNVPGAGTTEFKISPGTGHIWHGSIYDLNYSKYLGTTDANRVKSDMMSAPEIDSIKGTRVFIHNYWLNNTALDASQRNSSIEIQWAKYDGGMSTSTVPVFSGYVSTDKSATKYYNGVAYQTVYQKYNPIGYAYGYNKTENRPYKFANTAVSCWNELERVNDNVFALYSHVPGLGFSKYFITAVKPNNAVSNLQIAQSWNANGDPVHTLTWTPQTYDKSTMHTYEVWYRKKKVGTSSYEDKKTIGGTSREVWMFAGKASVKYKGAADSTKVVTSGNKTYTIPNATFYNSYEGCKFEHVAPRGDNGDGTKYERTYEYMVIPIYDASSHRGTEATTSIVTAPAPGKVYGNLYQVTEKNANGETLYGFSIRLDPYFPAGAIGSTEAKRLIITSSGGVEGSDKLKGATSVTFADGTPITPQEGITFVSKTDGSTTTHGAYAISIDITGKVGADGKLPSIIWHNVDPDLEYKMAVHVESSPTYQYTGSGEISTTLVVPCPTLSLTEVSVYPLLGDYSSIQNDDLLPLGAQRRVGSKEVTNPVTLSNANTIGTKGSAINPLLVTDEVMENWSVQYLYNIMFREPGRDYIAYRLEPSNTTAGATYYSNSKKVIFDIVGLPVERTAWDTHTQMGLDDAQKATNDNLTKYGYNTATANHNYTAHIDVTYTRKDNSEIKAVVMGENIASSPLVYSEGLKNGSIFPNLGVNFGTQFVVFKRTTTHWDASYPNDEDHNYGYFPIYYDAAAQWTWAAYPDNLNRYVGFHAVTKMNCVGHYVTNTEGQMSDKWVPYYAPSVLDDGNVVEFNKTLGMPGNFTDNYNGAVEPLVMTGIGYDGTKNSNWSALATEERTLPMQVHYVWAGDRDLTNVQTDREQVSTKVLMTADYPIIESTYGATIIHDATFDDSYYNLMVETEGGQTRMNMISSENNSGVYADYVTTVTGVEGILTNACGGWQLYPNPVGSFVTIEAPMLINDVKIFSMDGQLVKVVKDVKDTTVKINVEELPQGVYIVNTLGVAKMMIKL